MEVCSLGAAACSILCAFEYAIGKNIFAPGQRRFCNKSLSSGQVVFCAAKGDAILRPVGKDLGDDKMWILFKRDVANLVYKIPVQVRADAGQRLFVETPRFGGACIRVTSAKGTTQVLGWKPYKARRAASGQARP
jgi:hypothetical protein